MGLARKISMASAIGITSLLFVAGSAFAYSGSFGMYVPGGGNAVPLVTGEATNYPYVNVSSYSNSTEPFNVGLASTNGALLSGYYTVGSGSTVAWQTDTFSNGNYYNIVVGTGYFYGSGTIYGHASF